VPNEITTAKKSTLPFWDCATSTVIVKSLQQEMIPRPSGGLSVLKDNIFIEKDIRTKSNE
jgi:hypothetical protein